MTSRKWAAACGARWTNAADPRHWVAPPSGFFQRNIPVRLLPMWKVIWEVAVVEDGGSRLLHVDEVVVVLVEGVVGVECAGTTGHTYMAFVRFRGFRGFPFVVEFAGEIGRKCVGLGGAWLVSCWPLCHLRCTWSTWSAVGDRPGPEACGALSLTFSHLVTR
jgi:hypothetical protein